VLIGLLFYPAVVRGDGGSAATVTLDAPAEVAPGSDFIARVNILWLQDFDAAQFDITYDADVLQFTDVTDGLINSTAIPADWGFMPPGEPGTIRVITNVAGAPGVTGAGYLADIHFHVVGSACNTSALSLSNGVLSDKYGAAIPAIWIGTSVHVSGNTHYLFLPLLQTV